MILRRYILTELVFNLKWYDHIIKGDDGTFKGCITPMVNLGAYQFKNLNTGEITPEY